MDDYYGGYFFLAWDRSPDKCNRYHRHEIAPGSIDINLKASTDLTESVTVLVYCTYQASFQSFLNRLPLFYPRHGDHIC